MRIAYARSLPPVKFLRKANPVTFLAEIENVRRWGYHLTLNISRVCCVFGCKQFDLGNLGSFWERYF